MEAVYAVTDGFVQTLFGLPPVSWQINAVIALAALITRVERAELPLPTDWMSLVQFPPVPLPR